MLPGWGVEFSFALHAEKKKTLVSSGDQVSYGSNYTPMCDEIKSVWLPSLWAAPFTYLWGHLGFAKARLRHRHIPVPAGVMAF